MITDKMLSDMIGIILPWSISLSKFDMDKKTLEIHVKCASKYSVGDDGSRLTIHGYDERHWRQLNMFEFATRITSRIPRVKLPSQQADDDDEQQGGSGGAPPPNHAAEPGPKPTAMPKG